MIVTEMQLLVLLQTTADSLLIGDNPRLFSFTYETRKRTADEVANQQTQTLEAKKEPECSPR